MRERPQRRVFAVVDGIIGGEGDGPMNNSARKCGVLIAGIIRFLWMWFVLH